MEPVKFLNIFTDFENRKILVCDCEPIHEVLVRNGLFPTAPTQPRMAISILLLDFLNALFERSCEAINAQSSVLNAFYSRRGFRVLDKKVHWHMILTTTYT